MGDTDCHCVCGMHRDLATVQCEMTAATSIVITGRILGPVPIGMCQPCATWWLETQVDVQPGEPL